MENTQEHQIDIVRPWSKFDFSLRNLQRLGIFSAPPLLNDGENDCAGGHWDTFRHRANILSISDIASEVSTSASLYLVLRLTKKL